MRNLAAMFVLTALVTPIGAQQRAPIRWEPTGGPLVAQQKQIVAHRGRLLLVGTGGEWWRSPNGGKTWEPPEEQTPRPWIVAASQGTLFGDAIDGILRSSDMGDSWTRCGTVPVNRRTGNETTSIAADGSRVYSLDLQSRSFPLRRSMHYVGATRNALEARLSSEDHLRKRLACDSARARRVLSVG